MNDAPLTHYPESELEGVATFAIKVQFEGSTKLYEYAWTGGAQLPSPARGNLFAVVDARGDPKVVRVVDIVPYYDRNFEGDLKPVFAIFTGSILWSRPDFW